MMWVNTNKKNIDVMGYVVSNVIIGSVLGDMLYHWLNDV